MVDTHELLERRGRAVEDFERSEHFHGGEQVIEGLSAGLTQLRESLYERVHEDVETNFGFDSMMMPISEDKSRQMTKLEIEIFQIAVSAGMVSSHHYIQGNESWYLDWLTEFRLGALHSDMRVIKRLDFYRTRSPSEQRLAFSNALMSILPEARRAPLILFRLISPAVRIITAQAFGKTDDALDCRREQMVHLPSIADCHDCHGRLLENGESCHVCGNPLWNYEWLTAMDA